MLLIHPSDTESNETERFRPCPQAMVQEEDIMTQVATCFIGAPKALGWGMNVNSIRGETGKPLEEVAFIQRS